MFPVFQRSKSFAPNTHKSAGLTGELEVEATRSSFRSGWPRDRSISTPETTRWPSRSPEVPEFRWPLPDAADSPFRFLPDLLPVTPSRLPTQFRPENLRSSSQSTTRPVRCTFPPTRHTWEELSPPPSLPPPASLCPTQRSPRWLREK